MAKPLSASTLLSALDREGIKVAERDGWMTHDRASSGGAWGPVNGVIIHHTAGTDSLELVCSGTRDLPGPLCHSHLSKRGVATMVGHGRVNHAGLIAANAHRAVLQESPVHPPPDADSVDGNTHYYGLEIENLGDGEDPYPVVQYSTAVRWATALCRAHGWSAHSVIGHREATRRKSDPSFDMDHFRERVAERLRHDPEWGGEDEDMPTRTSLGKNDEQATPWSEWTLIRWDREFADPSGAHGDGNYPGYVSQEESWCDFYGQLRVTGLEVGDRLQVRYEVHEWRDGAATGEPWTEIVVDQLATSGDQVASLPWSKGLTKGQHVYVAVRPTPVGDRGEAAAPAVVGGRWAIRQDRG